MGKIVKKLPLLGDHAEGKATVLLDSGAGSSLVRRDMAEKISRHCLRIDPPLVFNMANGDEGMKSDEVRVLALRMKGKLLDGTFYVIDRMPREMIVGVDFMRTWQINLDLAKDDFTVGVDSQQIEIA